MNLPVDEARSASLRRQPALVKLLDKYLRPDDPCTCGSGRPVKKCCGLAAARRPGGEEVPFG